MTSTAVYRFWADQRLLYVGCSYNPWIRYGAHLSSKDWAKSATRMDIEWFDSREDALRAERVAIATERPAFNTLDVSGDIAKKATGAVGALAEWVAQSGMSQADFADACGAHFTAMSRILSNKRKPTRALAARISEVTGGSIPLSHWKFAPPKSKDPLIVERVLSLYASGLVAREVADRLGITHGIASLILVRHRAPKRKRPTASKYEADLRRLSALGLTQSDAARELGINQASVSVAASRLGIKFKDGRKASKATLAAERAAAISALAAKGMSVTDVARHLGIQQSTISVIKAQFGIEFPKSARRQTATPFAATFSKVAA